MGTVIDYLSWRGDLSFSEAGFNEVDNVVCSLIAYLPFGKIRDSLNTDTYGVCETAEFLIQNGFSAELEKSFVSSLEMIDFLEALAKAERYRDCFISDFIDEFDPLKQLQFSAMRISFDDFNHYVAFRGTDDTLTGWHEDFNLSFKKMASQESALIYLNKQLSKLEGQVRVGGHSKGGNLAVYASVFCDEPFRDKIVQVYDNDGPGLYGGFKETDAYSGIEHKIMKITPEFCVVGLLFNNQSDKIVQSKNKGVFQHDALSWMVYQSHFSEAKKFDAAALLLHENITDWLEIADLNERSELVNYLFSAMEQTGAKTMFDLTHLSSQDLFTLAANMTRLTPKTRSAIYKIIQTLVLSAAFQQVKPFITEKEKENINKRAMKISYITQILGDIPLMGNIFRRIKISSVTGSYFLILCGLFSILSPQNGMLVIAKAFILFMLIIVATLLSVCMREKDTANHPWKLSGLAVMILGLFALLFMRTVTLFIIYLLLGMFLIWDSYQRFNKGMIMRKSNDPMWWSAMIFGVAAGVLGLLSFYQIIQVYTPYSISIGLFLVILGMSEIGMVKYKKKKTNK